MKAAGLQVADHIGHPVYNKYSYGVLFFCLRYGSDAWGKTKL